MFSDSFLQARIIQKKLRIFRYNTLVKVSRHPTYTKISDARTIKNRWLKTKTSTICAEKNQIKISVIKKRLLRTNLGQPIQLKIIGECTIKRF